MNIFRSIFSGKERHREIKSNKLIFLDWALNEASSISIEPDLQVKAYINKFTAKMRIFLLIKDLRGDFQYSREMNMHEIPYEWIIVHGNEDIRCFILASPKSFECEKNSKIKDNSIIGIVEKEIFGANWIRKGVLKKKSKDGWRDKMCELYEEKLYYYAPNDSFHFL